MRSLRQHAPHGGQVAAVALAGAFRVGGGVGFVLHQSAWAAIASSVAGPSARRGVLATRKKALLSSWLPSRRGMSPGPSRLQSRLSKGRGLPLMSALAASSTAPTER